MTNLLEQLKNLQLTASDLERRRLSSDAAPYSVSINPSLPSSGMSSQGFDSARSGLSCLTESSVASGSDADGTAEARRERKKRKRKESRSGNSLFVPRSPNSEQQLTHLEENNIEATYSNPISRALAHGAELRARLDFSACLARGSTEYQSEEGANLTFAEIQQLQQQKQQQELEQQQLQQQLLQQQQQQELEGPGEMSPSDGGEFRSESGLESSSEDDDGLPMDRRASTETAWLVEPSVEPPKTADEEVLMLSLLSEALASSIIFQGCPHSMLQGVAGLAEHVILRPGEEVILDDEERLLVVLKGELQARVGEDEPFSRTIGPGQVLNGVNYCCLRPVLNEHLPKKSQQVAASKKKGFSVARQRHQIKLYDNCYLIDHPPTAHRSPLPPEGHTFNWGQTVEPSNVGDFAFWGLCPYGTLPARPLSEGLSPLDIIGARAFTRREEMSSVFSNNSPTSTGLDANFDLGGALVAWVPSWSSLGALARSPVALRKSGVQMLAEGLEVLEKRIFDCSSTWAVLVSVLCCYVLPGVSAEVVFEVTRHAQTFSVDAGAEIIQEGGLDDDIIIVVDGVGTVERKVGVNPETMAPVTEVLGRVVTGAVCGDLATIGFGFPRIATLRAKTTMKCIRLSSKGVLSTMSLFPGMLRSSEGWLHSMANALQHTLPSKNEVVRSLGLFAGFSVDFISDLALAGQRKTVVFGEVLITQGSPGGTLNVIENGRCSVEINGSKVAEIPTGNCFGERTILGSAEANATIRVSTSFALILQITREMLEGVTLESDEDRHRLETIKAEPPLGRAKGSKLRNVELFRFCSQQFLELLAASCSTKNYLPGQSVCVEGEQEEDVRMLVLVGGKLGVELNGQTIGAINHGSTFGERAFLGQAQKRAVTIRTMELSSLLEIPQRAFTAALQEFPEDEGKFKQGLGQGLGASKVLWPFLATSEARFSFLVDLNAESVRLENGSKTLQDADKRESAILVITGQLDILDDRGKLISVLKPGDTHNEQVLLKAEARKGETIVATGVSEVKLLSRTHLNKVLSEFPAESEPLSRAILKHMCDKNVKELGYSGGVAELLAGVTALFHEASPECLAEAALHVVPHYFHIGEKIAGLGSDPTSVEYGDDLYILLEGEASYQDFESKVTVRPGQCFGEPVMVGVARKYPGILVSEQPSMLLTLSGATAMSFLPKHPATFSQLERLKSQAYRVDADKIQKILLKSPSFGPVNKDILGILCPRANIEIFYPGQLIVANGEKCEIGKTNFYILLGGQVCAEGNFGTHLATMKAGVTFGEMGAFGLTVERTASTRAARDGLAACAVIRGQSIQRALEMRPDAFSFMLEHYQKQLTTNKATLAQRKEWLDGTAVPGLANTKLFAGCAWEFLQTIAMELNESEHNAGDMIAVSGTETNSMLVVLEGEVELITVNGEVAGTRGPGATVGDTACLGLFPRWMTSVRAKGPCRTLEVTEDALRKALDSPGGTALKEGVARLEEERRSQVASGLPLSMLTGIHINPQEAGPRIVGLLSERLVLAPGEVLEPDRDTASTGSQYCFINKGRVMVEFNQVEVQPLAPGTVVHEGLLAEFDARIRADLSTELYRISCSDFGLAVASDPNAQRWIWQFRLKEREMLKKLRGRLTNARGVRTVARAREQEIHEYVTEKATRANRAKNLKNAREDYHLELLPPATAPVGFHPQVISTRQGSHSITSSKSSTEMPSLRRRDKKASSKLRLPAHAESGAGLKYYPVVKLPRIGSREPSGGSLQMSRSLPSLSNKGSISAPRL